MIFSHVFAARRIIKAVKEVFFFALPLSQRVQSAQWKRFSTNNGEIELISFIHVTYIKIGRQLIFIQFQGFCHKTFYSIICPII